MSARNSAPNSLATWNEAASTGVPAGPADRDRGARRASGSLTDGTTASIAWDGAFADNGAAISDYYVAIYTGAAPDLHGDRCRPGFAERQSAARRPVHAPRGRRSDQHQLRRPHAEPDLLDDRLRLQRPGLHRVAACPGDPARRAGHRHRPSRRPARCRASPATWDFRLDGFTIGSGSTDADTFSYRLIGGDDRPVAERRPVDPGTLLTTGNGSHYGNSLSVQVKACKAYPEATLCSPDWSPSFPLGGAA